MVLWRISLYRDLSGSGGLRLGGRWHEAGNRVVYMGESPSAVLLEVCAHTSANDVPESFLLMRIEGPDVEVSDLPGDALPEDWVNQMELTQRVGTAWLQQCCAPLLRVPSAIVPHTWNYLFNPAHLLAAEFRIVEAEQYPFDVRIKR